MSQAPGAPKASGAHPAAGASIAPAERERTGEEDTAGSAGPGAGAEEAGAITAVGVRRRPLGGRAHPPRPAPRSARLPRAYRRQRGPAPRARGENRASDSGDPGVFASAVPAAEHTNGQPKPAAPFDGVPETVTLEDLITARRAPHRPQYRALEERFVKRNGVISDSFFAQHIDAAALLIQPTGLSARLRQSRKIKLRYDGSKAAMVQPEFEAALWRARAMERESALVLGGRPRRVLVEMLFSITIYLLSVLDALDLPGAKGGAQDRVEAAIRAANTEYDRLETFKRLAARRRSLRWYVLGLPLGGILGFLLTAVADRLEPFGVSATPVVFCLGSGGIGAMVSVMIRITRGQRLLVDSEQGAAVTVLAGAFRPLIGAVFGVALYVLITAGIVPLDTPEDEALAIFFFAGIAFIAGFSERWAQDTIVRSTPSVSVPMQNEPTATTFPPARPRDTT